MERDDRAVESVELTHCDAHVVVEIGSRSGGGDLAVWCAQIESLLTTGGADVITCDVAHLDGSAGAVIHALVRLQLTARRCGGAIQLFRPPPALLELLRIAGLTEVLPVSELRDSAMRFITTVELGGKTATGFEVPDEVVDALARGKRPPVTVTVRGHTYRSTIAVMGGRYLLPLSAENRSAAGVAAGEQVEVDVELDTEPRVLDVPDDLTAAIATDGEAQVFWDSLSYSRRQRIVLSVNGTKSAETRARRIAKSVTDLRDHKA